MSESLFADLRQDTPKESTKKSIFAFFKYSVAFIVLLLALIGGLVVFLISNILSDSSANDAITALPDKFILKLDLDTSFNEAEPSELLDRIVYKDNQSFYQSLRSLKVAAKDPRVKAIYATISDSAIGLAQSEEFYKAIKAFRKAGKKAYIFSESFGSLGGGSSEYHLATAFDKIYLQPTGEVGITGISIETPFFKKTLDKYGIKPRFIARKEYKDAMNSFMYDDMTEAQRTSTTALANGLFNQLIGDISKARKISKDKFMEYVNNAPILANDAFKAGLVDDLKYQHELEKELIKEFSTKDFVYLDEYSRDLKPAHKFKSKIAFLKLEGVISSGDNLFAPQLDGAIIGSQSVIEMLDEIADNKDVKALVIRINSPGGSFGAADAIWHRLKQFNIPVIISMGDYAASGGYYIAMAGNKIYADNNTITGSIGVFSGKIVFEEMWEKLGVKWETIKIGDNADITSLNKDFSKKSEAKFTQILDSVYNTFVTNAANSRNMSVDQMEALAKGRVWTGTMAVNNGLIDAIGGVNDAIAEAAKQAKLGTINYNLITYPREKSKAELIREFIEKNALSNAGEQLSTKYIQKQLQNSSVFRKINTIYNLPHGELTITPMQIN